ncbi:hypothetical protein HNQ07_003102 [Deinococcus metalli]|uniref:Calcineurin-like phosphoesterase domain-containing protein n=1 Tax=Deinococcus metalli TaxID=1141878 RepID=A0A7W8KI45_9DEIO|nr:metallophosphoesterase [Deinococcus metalli]MBB5377603.1 hypothetical protein [Deinococcus metalli]GHF52000.1 hypothetical protein GCM10017781_30300 [Deinococcus metalli]
MSPAGLDVIGDVHGCHTELVALLDALGYAWNGGALVPPPGRRAVFVGDLVDRGPDVVEVVRLVRRAVQGGAALSVRGNHDERLARALGGDSVEATRSLHVSLAQLSAVDAAERDAVWHFLAALPARLELDGGRLLVVHAGELDTDDPATRERFNVWGTAPGVPPELDWAGRYTGSALVASGHTSVLSPKWRGRTVNLDTGCVFGGQLTALRYPELDVVAVPARRAYASTAHWRALTGVGA